jgi:hypothetical protein
VLVTSDAKLLSDMAMKKQGKIKMLNELKPDFKL